MTIVSSFGAVADAILYHLIFPRRASLARVDHPRGVDSSPVASFRIFSRRHLFLWLVSPFKLASNGTNDVL